MPKVGLSRPYVAKYNNNGGNVAYSNGMRFGRAVEYGTDIETSDGNDFYADNVIAESVTGVFTGGTLNMTTAELDAKVSKFILGLKTGEITIDGTVVKELYFDENAKNPDLGFGVIIKNIIRDVTSWTAVILTKIKFNTPGDSVTTEGEEIEWQTAETEATIMRDDTPDHRWQIRAENLPTEALADKYIRTKLNMPIEDIQPLTVTSVAGTQEGYTVITVSPTLTAGNQYKYRLGSNLEMPYFDQSIDEEDGFVLWDGSSEIDSAGSSQILVVEVTADSNAQKAGIASITAYEVVEG